MMPPKKQAKLVLLIVIILVFGIASMFYLKQNSKQQTPESILHNPISHSLTAKLVDPSGKVKTTSTSTTGVVTLNFFALLLDNWMGLSEATYSPQGPLPFTYTDGSTGTQIDTEYEGIGSRNCRIAVGSGTGVPSPSDIDLFNRIATIGPLTERGYNTTHYWISLTATFTFESNTTITEVGLFAFVWIASKYLLLVHDILDTPVSVSANESLDINYVIYFTAPLTLQFLETFYKYLLSGITQDSPSLKDVYGFSVSGFDFGIDYFDESYWQKRDSVLERIIMHIGASVGHFEIERYCLESINQGGLHFQNYVEVTYRWNASVFIISITASFNINTNCTISEIGIELYTDGDLSDDCDSDQFLIMYFPLDQSIQLTSGPNAIRLTVYFYFHLR